MSDNVVQPISQMADPQSIDKLKSTLEVADKVIQHWDALQAVNATSGISLEKITTIRNLTAQLIAALES